MTKEVWLPESGDTSKTRQIIVNNMLVIVGANGSGKSRIGKWFELTSPQPDTRVCRISASRDLTLPETIRPATLEQEENRLHFGLGHNQIDRLENQAQRRSSKISRKYRNKLNNGPVSDYEQLLSVLFAEENLVAGNYFHKAHAGTADHNNLPTTRIQALTRVWNGIFPHRSLIFKSGDVHLSFDSGGTYEGKEMSDGERVAVYLIGQVLCAPKNSLLIVDEPEIHIHRSLRDRLWDSLESERRDCTFIYLSHDLEFVASRIDPVVVNLQGFDGKNWQWNIVDDSKGLPRDLLLRILGSRADVLFVEGKNDSLDNQIYPALFPQKTVIPVRGGCSAVLNYTPAINNLSKELHPSVFAAGIIDGDTHTTHQRNLFRKKGVYTLTFRTVENLFLAPEVLMAVAKQLNMDVETAVKEAIDTFFSNLEKNKFESSWETARDEIRRVRFSPPSKSDLGQEHAEWAKNIDASKIEKTWLGRFDQCVASRDYTEGLSLYCNKGLLPEVGKRVFNTENYQQLVINMLRSGNTELRDAFNKYLPPELS